MSLTIELNGPDEARLVAAAKREGVPPQDLARRVLVDHLSPLDEPVEIDLDAWSAQLDRLGDPFVEPGEWERFQASLTAVKRR